MDKIIMNSLNTSKANKFLNEKLYELKKALKVLKEEVFRLCKCRKLSKT
ncbi:MAG: hypothetical protein PWR09_368 [Archaeoglobi archaeon]|nr:hypothetical protein [Archaeoglobi archaeon]